MEETSHPAGQKRKTQKVFLTNTGPGAFVVTDAEGGMIEIPGRPQLPLPPPAAPPPPNVTRQQYPEGQNPPWIKEVELDEGTLEHLKKRHERGSPLHVGKETEEQEEEQRPQTAEDLAKLGDKAPHVPAGTYGDHIPDVQATKQAQRAEQGPDMSKQAEHKTKR